MVKSPIRASVIGKGMHPLRGLNYFIIVSLFILFFVTLGYPLGNEKLPATVFGSYDSVGAALIFIGMPLVLLHINYHIAGSY